MTAWDINLKRSGTAWQLLFTLVVIISLRLISTAQDGETGQRGENLNSKASESELVDGLLELLDTPDSRLPTMNDESGDASKIKIPFRNPTRSFKAEAGGATGFGSVSAVDRSPDERELENQLQVQSMRSAVDHPLQAVTQGMHAAADLLQSGRSLAQTVELQGDLLRQLDQWISAVQESQLSPASSQPVQEQLSKQQAIVNQSSDRTNAEVAPDQTPSSEADSNETQYSSDDQLRQASSSDQAQSPGQSGTAGPLVLNPKDPVSLQQGAWGHLPAQTRSQMQSRMVEQFLPNYRERLEAYYRALLQKEPKP